MVVVVVVVVSVATEVRGSGIAGAFAATTGTFQAGFVGFEGSNIDAGAGAAEVSLVLASLVDFVVMVAAAAAAAAAGGGVDDGFLP
jgi:hypothetical protein